VLRRTKAQVALDIPPKCDLILYHPLSELQKKYYKAILMKDAGRSSLDNSRTWLASLIIPYDLDYVWFHFLMFYSSVWLPYLMEFLSPHGTQCS